MTYAEWLTFIKTQDDPNYWDNVIHYAPNITKDLIAKKQFQVAKQLQITETKLSVLAPIIKSLGMK